MVSGELQQCCQPLSEQRLGTSHETEGQIHLFSKCLTAYPVLGRAEIALETYRVFSLFMKSRTMIFLSATIEMIVFNLKVKFPFSWLHKIGCGLSPALQRIMLEAR